MLGFLVDFILCKYRVITVHNLKWESYDAVDFFANLFGILEISFISFSTCSVRQGGIKGNNNVGVNGK